MRNSFATSILRAFLCSCTALSLSAVWAEDSCEGIAKDVSTAVAKEPGKVLMIVEDALVINETCANSIIKAAIVASNANATLVNQIVQTGISVAPKMTAAIMDAASAAAPGASITGPVVVAAPSGKEAKNPIPVVEAEDDDFVAVPSSLRGIYLLQPPPGGFLPRDPKKRPCEKVCVSPTQHVPYYP